MECKNCGAQIHGHPARCPECDTRLKPKRPPLLIRGIFTLASVVVYLVLIGSLLAAALLTDISRLTSSGGIQGILDHLLTSDQSVSAEPVQLPSPQGGQLHLLSSGGNSAEDEEDKIKISFDMLTSSESLNQFLTETVQNALGESTTITVEQVSTFIEESTLMEFVADKTASLLEDIFTGTENTTLTADDFMGLVEENQALIEEVFQIKLTDEIKQEISASLTESLGEEDLAAQLRAEVAQTLEEPIEELNGMNIRQLLALLQQLIQPVVLVIAYILCLALMALLCGLSYYNIPKGLRWSATACLTAGLVLSIPTAIIQFYPAALAQQISEMEQPLFILSSIARVLAPVHYTIAGVGAALYVLAIMWRLVKRR